MELITPAEINVSNDHFIIQISVEISNEKILTHFIYLIGLLEMRPCILKYLCVENGG